MMLVIVMIVKVMFVKFCKIDCELVMVKKIDAVMLV